VRLEGWGYVGVVGIIVANLLLLSMRAFASRNGLAVRWWSRSLGRERQHLRSLAQSPDRELARRARRYLRLEILGWVVAVSSMFIFFSGVGSSNVDRALYRWRGDFETADFSQWSYRLNPRGLSIVDAPVAEGKHAARVEITAQDLWSNGLNRVEVQYKPSPKTVAEDHRSCFGWRFYLPVALSEARHQIGYWESYPSYKQIMSFEVRGQAISFVTRLPSERVHWAAPDAVTPGVWHQIAMCAAWSVDPAVGAVDVWFDGRYVVTRGSAQTLWNQPTSPNFIQIGILRDVPAAPEVMFLDDAFESADFAPAVRH